MDQSKKIFLLFCCTILFIGESSSLLVNANTIPPTKIYKTCSESKFPNSVIQIGTPFQKMLDLGSNILKAAATQYFADTHIVEDTTLKHIYRNKLVATYQCQGGIPSDTCSQCVTSAFQILLNDCPESMEARVQMDSCFVMYSFERDLEGYSDATLKYKFCDTSIDNAHAPDIKYAIDYALMNTVVVNPPVGTYTYAIPNDPNTSIYALGQCHSYQTSDQCRNCLTQAKQYGCNGPSIRGQVYLGSCYYRYDTTPFFDPNFHADPKTFYPPSNQ